MDRKSENYDYLQFIGDKEITYITKEETIYFSDKIIKINRFNMSQERNIIITNKALYNLKKKSTLIYEIYNYIELYIYLILI